MALGPSPENLSSHGGPLNNFHRPAIAYKLPKKNNLALQNSQFFSVLPPSQSLKRTNSEHVVTSFGYVGDGGLSHSGHLGRVGRHTINRPKKEVRAQKLLPLSHFRLINKRTTRPIFPHIILCHSSYLLNPNHLINKHPSRPFPPRLQSELWVLLNANINTESINLPPRQLKIFPHICTDCRLWIQDREQKMSLQALDTTTDIPDAYKLALSESRRWYLQHQPPP